MIIFFWLVVPESPKWLYTWFKFDEARDELGYVSRFNYVKKIYQDRIAKLQFDIEILKEQVIDNERDKKSQISKRR